MRRALHLQNSAPAAEGRDAWGGVLDELRQRPLACMALGFLALVHALAIYAPLLANDRPLLLEAVDFGAYDKARRSLVGVASSLRGLALEGPAAYAETRSDLPLAPAFGPAVEAERGALEMRLDIMRSYLEAEDHAALDELQNLASGLALRLSGSVDLELWKEEAAPMLASARSVRRNFGVHTDGFPDGVELQARRSYPLFESIAPLEVFCMVLWALLLFWPLWSLLTDRWLLSSSRGRRRRIKWMGVLGLSLVAALIWSQTLAAGSAFDVSGYKTGLTEGKIAATKVVFAPLAIGFAESHVEESYRPPTWTSASEIDDRGAYLRGGRAPEVDPASGLQPVTTPVEVRFGEAGRNSAWRHPLGTDEIGRDLLVRMLYGARISLAVGLVSTLILALIGITIGALAGYAGGRTDLMLSRLIEIVQCVPAFFLILTAVAIVPADSLHPIFAIVLFIGVVRWTGIARLMRAECLRLREQEFVLAARATGLSPFGVVLRHVIPNALGPVLVAISFSAAAGILTESAISFLGFGVREPIPSWGSLLSESRAAEHWWLQVFPGLAIFATVLAYNLVGEGVRDALDPRISTQTGRP